MSVGALLIINTYPILSYPILTYPDVGETTVIEMIVTFFDVGGKLGSYHWHVPVSVSSSANPKKAIASTLLDQKSCTLTLNGVKPDQWIKVSPYSDLKRISPDNKTFKTEEKRK